MTQYGSSSIGRQDDRHRLLADDGDDQMLDTNGPLATTMSSSQRINPFNTPPPQTALTAALEGAPAAPPAAVFGLSSGGSGHMRVQTPRVAQRDGELEQITLEHDPLVPALVPMFQPLYSFILAFIFVALLVHSSLQLTCTSTFNFKLFIATILICINNLRGSLMRYLTR